MAKPSWFNDNRNRAYPFVAGTVDADTGTSVKRLPNASVLDAGFVLGTGFSVPTDDVYLKSVSRFADVFTFEFVVTGSDARLLFQRPASATTVITEFDDLYYDSVSESVSESFTETCDEPVFYGFLVTGDLTELDALLPANGELVADDGDAVIEPALVQSLAGSFVSGVSIANADRTRVDAPEGCESEPADDGVIYVRQRCIAGEVTFKSGYNITVQQNNSARSITFRPGVGSGAGQPCEEIPLFDGESPPEGSNLLSGGPQCGELLRSINGVAGPDVPLLAGLGFTITVVPDTNTIIVNADFSNVATCYSDDSSLVEISEELSE